MFVLGEGSSGAPPDPKILKNFDWIVHKILDRIWPVDNSIKKFCIHPCFEGVQIRPEKVWPLCRAKNAFWGPQNRPNPAGIWPIFGPKCRFWAPRDPSGPQNLRFWLDSGNQNRSILLFLKENMTEDSDFRKIISEIDVKIQKRVKNASFWL